jgi:ABC-type glycerol-3-phosphate transport system permease component
MHKFMKRIGLHFLLLVLAIIALTPLLWVIRAACASPADSSQWSPENFIQLIHHEQFGRWLVNSIFLASTQTVVVVTLSSLGGFALAKYHFPGKRILMLIMLGTMLLPAQVLLPGSYELMYGLGWIDSYLAILVPGAVSVLGIFLFRQAMISVPDELLQCARLDGCGELRLWWDIALPIVRPMVAAFTLLSFLAAWNSFLWPQIVLQNEARFTLPMALNNLNSLTEYQQNPGMLMAGTLISILPVIFLFFALQKDFITGLASGAVKG